MTYKIKATKEHDIAKLSKFLSEPLVSNATRSACIRSYSRWNRLLTTVVVKQFVYLV